MIKFIGDGGHAKVVRDILRYRPRVMNEEGWIVAVGDNANRKAEAEACPGPFINAISIHAIVSSSAIYGEGTVICEGAIVQAGVKIGRHVIINAGAVITHDCVIEDFAHIAPGAHLCGNVHVGEGALVGVGVGVAPGARIPAWSICKAARLDIEQQHSLRSYQNI